MPTMTGTTGTTGTTSANLLIDFDDPAATYTLSGFGGTEASSVVADPTNPANMVAEVVKPDIAETWAGTTFGTLASDAIPTLPITATDTTFTMRVYSTRAGIPVRLKVKDSTNPTRSVETEATTTLANTWKILSFDFSTNGASGGGGTFWFDDLATHF